jgi:hypothetical protein
MLILDPVILNLAVALGDSPIDRRRKGAPQRRRPIAFIGGNTAQDRHGRNRRIIAEAVASRPFLQQVRCERRAQLGMACDRLEVFPDPACAA